VIEVHSFRDRPAKVLIDQSMHQRIPTTNANLAVAVPVLTAGIREAATFLDNQPLYYVADTPDRRKSRPPRLLHIKRLF